MSYDSLNWTDPDAVRRLQGATIEAAAERAGRRVGDFLATLTRLAIVVWVEMLALGVLHSHFETVPALGLFETLAVWVAFWFVTRGVPVE